MHSSPRILIRSYFERFKHAVVITDSACYVIYMKQLRRSRVHPLKSFRSDLISPLGAARFHDSAHDPPKSSRPSGVNKPPFCTDRKNPPRDLQMHTYLLTKSLFPRREHTLWDLPRQTPPELHTHERLIKPTKCLTR